jgi:hypothetical protein
MAAGCQLAWAGVALGLVLAAICPAPAAGFRFNVATLSSFSPSLRAFTRLGLRPISRRQSVRAPIHTCMQIQDADVGSSIMLPEGLYRLNAELRVAVQMEDFKKAAELRDSIRTETARDPVARLLAELKEASDEEEFEKAKELKLQLASAVKGRAQELRDSRGRPQYKVNRLLILSNDGSLVTTDPEGNFPVTLSEPSAKGKETFMQPCWRCAHKSERERACL